MIQSSTRYILDSFNVKTNSLSASYEDIGQLMRVGYDAKIAYRTARSLFGSDTVEFLAIDGTMSEDQKLDMLVFYTAAFGYVGKLEFADSGCVSSEPVSMENNGKDISAAIPIHEEDVGEIMGVRKEGNLEIDVDRLPSALMQLAEYYIAIKTLLENPNIKVVIFDRQLAIDVPHLISNVTEVMENETSTFVLDGVETEFGKVTNLDLELARMLHPNKDLQIPSPRSQFLKFAAINTLLSKRDTISGYEDLLNKAGANKERLQKLSKDLKKFNNKFKLFDSGNISKEDSSDIKLFDIDPNMKDYWQRVFSAAVKMADHIFDTPLGEHPLVVKKDGINKWITTYDVEYLTLMMIYSLVRLAWEKHILILGIIKDMAAAELIKTVIPILESNDNVKFKNKLPKFSNDRMLLQCNSVINAKFVNTPWKTFEFDACFRTMAPVIQEMEDDGEKRTEAKKIQVKGAFKNLISAERMFVKSYIQLWSSAENPAVRSYVFSYDRPCYPKYDIEGELILHHHDSNVDELIRPMIHFREDSHISHLVMAILTSMSSVAIPECIGHNYPLFLADKKAKAILRESRRAYLSAVSFELAHSKLDQQVLFGPSFREFRSSMERARRNA
jgi:hypothetical protein